MTDRPILFSHEMVSAILEGRKTQTRRIIHPQPPRWRWNRFPWDDRCINIGFDSLTDPYYVIHPKGKKGDRLWVRETFQGQTQSGKWWHEVKREDRNLLNWAWTNPIDPAFPETPPRWISGRFMPRMACRIMLLIVNVRVEKLQNITREDAQAEGVGNIWEWTNTRKIKHPEHFERGLLNPYIANFSVLWDGINGERGYGWNENPWVWVIDFRKVAI